MREFNATPDQIEQELARLVDEGVSLPDAFTDVLMAFRAHREFWTGEPTETAPGAETVAHSERAKVTFEVLNGAAHRYRELRAKEFMRRITAVGNGLCTNTQTIVPANLLTLTWVEELVWMEDTCDDGEWWSQRVRSLRDLCPCCQTLLARNDLVVARGDIEPEDKIFRRDPVVHEAKFEGRRLLVKGLRFDLEEHEPIEIGGRPMTRRPTVEMVPTGTDEWFEWKDGAYTEFTDRRKPEYSHWLSDQLAAEVDLAPTFTVFAPPQDYMVSLGKLGASLRPT